MPNTQSIQVKVTLPKELSLLIKNKADKFGLNLSSYLRHLAISDIKDQALPTFPMSTKTEALGQRALKEFKAGKTIKVDDIDNFFTNL